MADALSARRRVFKKEAREVLCFRANWISVLMALFMLFFFLAAARYFSDCLYYALSLSGLIAGDFALADEVYDAASGVLLFLLLSPLYPGIVSYLYDLCRTKKSGGARVPITEVFCFYSGLEQAVRGWAVSFLRLTALIPLLFAYVGFVFLEDLYLPSIAGLPTQVTAVIFEVLIYAGTVLLIFTAMFMSLRAEFFVFFTVTRPELPISSCIRLSGNMMKRRAGEGIHLILSFVPLFILSVLSAGILFFIYFLPYYLFTFLIFCAAVTTEADA